MDDHGGIVLATVCLEQEYILYAIIQTRERFIRLSSPWVVDDNTM